MDRYDNYNPEILYHEELPPVEAPKDDASVNKNSGKDKGRKRTGSRKPSTASGSKKNASADSRALSKRLADWFHSSTFRFICGILLGGFGIYLCVAFVSFFANCIEDQALIDNSAVGSAAGIGNKAGEGGARISEILINRCFGLGSFVIILWLMAMSLKLLLGKPHFKSVNFTIKCFVALITVSLIVGLLTIATDSPINWGGYHGRYVNRFIVDFTGWWGAAILCIMLVAIFVVICMRDLIVWINAIRRKRAEHRRAVAEERARRLEEQRVIEEMRRVEQQDDISAEGGAHEEEEDSHDSTVSFGDTSYPEIGEEEDSATLGYRLDDEGETSEADDAREADDVPENSGDSDGLGSSDSSEGDEESEETDGLEKADRMVVNVNSVAMGDEKGPVDHRSEFYKFPPLDILRPGSSHIALDADEQLENKEKIRMALADYGIPITSITATVGPTVTLYEIRPDKGKKVSQIKSLVDDISLRLSATGVRIIAPIPGKGTVGIEVANKDPQTVSMRTVIGSRRYQESKAKLPVALGCTINNEVYIADLTKMPHLLVAGATGQGKSVGLNVLIASLLYRKKPHELKFVMIDPKMVEFALYAKIEKHYLAKLQGEDKAIITDMTKAVNTLNSLVEEMEQRYQLLMNVGCRKFEEYNEKFLSGKLSEKDGHRYMPYIVVVIDEFADLIMSQGKEVEKPIARLAQKARAVGIHEIIATQRPSTTVITGNIKANFLTRIAFKVSSSIDSKTILDTTGAQQLIGTGDMLINFNSEMTRVQCAFIDTPEVEALTEYIARQPYGGGPYILPEPPMLADGDGAGGFDLDGGPNFAKDPKFLEVAQYVIQSGYASTSNIQRRFELGYNRAGKIMDNLEALGIVGPATGGKPRAITMSPQEAMEVLRQFM